MHQVILAKQEVRWTTRVPAESNPYRPPHQESSSPLDTDAKSGGTLFSVFMIVAGVFFCVASLGVVFVPGLSELPRLYKSGWFVVTFMIFYGVLGGATALFHLSYLTTGWPTQALAGMYGIATGLVFAGLFMVIMHWIM